MLDFLWVILLMIIGLVLGFSLLLIGRRALVLTTAIVCLTAVGSLLALIYLGENTAWSLTKDPDLMLLGITAVAGIIGGILGSRREHIAASVVGFFAGAYIGLWFYDVAFYLVVDLAHWPEQTAFWVGVLILLAGGIIGLILTRRSEAIALIMVSVFVGTDLIAKALGLNTSKSSTAVITISLALLGLVVQYAYYLRDSMGDDLYLFTENGTAQTPAPEYFDLSDDTI